MWISTQKVSFSTALQTLKCLFKKTVILTCVISLCGFDLHFSDDWQCQAFFHIPIGHLYIFREMSIQALGQFFNWVIRFWNVFFLSCRRSLFVWQLIPYKICASLLFHSVDVSFGLKKLFSLIYSHLSIFALLPVLLTSYPLNHEATCFYFWWSLHISKI